MKDGKSIDWKENMNNGKDKWGENIERNKMKKGKDQGIRIMKRSDGKDA